jgi:hypothetical protein
MSISDSVHEIARFSVGVELSSRHPKTPSHAARQSSDIHAEAQGDSIAGTQRSPLCIHAVKFL